MLEVNVKYFALLRDEAGLDGGNIQTNASTLRQLYNQLQDKHGFTLGESSLKVAVNDEYTDLDSCLVGGSRIVFIPPVSGGRSV